LKEIKDKENQSIEAKHSINQQATDSHSTRHWSDRDLKQEEKLTVAYFHSSLQC
jgi:hypothetical protein